MYSFNLPFISPGALVEAVIDVDTSALNKERASGEELQGEPLILISQVDILF